MQLAPMNNLLAVSSPASSMENVCSFCTKKLDQGNTTYLYRDRTYCSADCRAKHMTPSSSASSTEINIRQNRSYRIEAWRIPAFKQTKEESKMANSFNRRKFVKGWGPTGVFRSPSTEFLTKYLRDGKIAGEITTCNVLGCRIV
ncbi:hypothetical protein AAMO2058_001476700 [Amorphochlora amoebiformis]